MKNVLLIFLLMPLMSLSQIKAFVITGGHKYDEGSFHAMWEAMPDLEVNYFVQPDFNVALEDQLLEQADVWIFYDMYQEISESQKEALIASCKEGQAMLFLHHALVSYQNWPEYEKIVGGRYYAKNRYPEEPESGYSTYLHDTNLEIQPVREHKLSRNMEPFVLFDEVYGNFMVLNNVKPILKTNHKQSSPIIAWENKYLNSKIIYIEPGHGAETFANQLYRDFLWASINYLLN